MPEFLYVPCPVYTISKFFLFHIIGRELPQRTENCSGESLQWRTGTNQRVTNVFFSCDSTVLFAMTSSQVEIQHVFSPLTYSFPCCMSKNWSFPDPNLNTISQLVHHDSFHNQEQNIIIIATMLTQFLTSLCQST